MPTIDKSPIYIDLDQRRRVEFSLNTANVISKHVAPGSSLWENVGEFVDPKDGETKKRYDINSDNLIIYLWACLQTGERMDGKPYTLSIEDTGDLIGNKRKATAAYLKIEKLLARYYGDEPGEAHPAAR